MSHKNPEERREYQRKYYQRNKEKIKKYAKEWRENNKERVSANRKHTSKKYRIEKEYGITYEEYSKCMNTSDVCEICGTTERLCYDHDHQTNKFRGVLCSNCNSGVGLLGDNLDIIRKAEEYLRRHYEEN